MPSCTTHFHSMTTKFQVLSPIFTILSSPVHALGAKRFTLPSYTKKRTPQQIQCLTKLTAILSKCHKLLEWAAAGWSELRRLGQFWVNNPISIKQTSLNHVHFWQSFCHINFMPDHYCLVVSTYNLGQEPYKPGFPDDLHFVQSFYHIHSMPDSRLLSGYNSCSGKWMHWRRILWQDQIFESQWCV